MRVVGPPACRMMMQRCIVRKAQGVLSDELGDSEAICFIIVVKKDRFALVDLVWEQETIPVANHV
jgi:hypothetical protein